MKDHSISSMNIDKKAFFLTTKYTKKAQSTQSQNINIQSL